MNRKSVSLLHDLRKEFESEQTKIVISGCVGPRGDGYNPADLMTEQEAQDYHSSQIEALSLADADMLTALTMTNVGEAVGLTRAARAAGIPVTVSFTVETDGKLSTGQTLKSAIEAVDQATEQYPIYYMINCAHPTHFYDVLSPDETWLQRIRGIRANASAKSHAELDEAEVLDEGNPNEMGRQYRELQARLKNLNVLGGCCGTDHRHIEAALKACATSVEST